MLKPTSDIEVPQAKNELTKFCYNPTMFEPLITGLKITGLVPLNLDRFPVLLFLCITHCGVCSTLSTLLIEAAVAFSLRMEARVFLIYFLGNNFKYCVAF